MELDTYAQWAWLSGRVGEAIDLYLDIARVYKKFPHVHFKLGYLCLTIQDFPNAVRHFTLEIERSTGLASSSGAHQSNTAAGIDEGQEGGDQATGMTPSKPQLTTCSATQEKAFLCCASLGRSEAHTALKEDAKAENDLLFVSNRGGNAKHMLVAMGVLFSHFGMHLRAEDCFDKCAEIDAGDPDYLIAHAELRLVQKRYVKAARMFEKCRASCSATSATYHRALIGEGAALLRQNKLQDAVILLLQAMNNLRTCIRNKKKNPLSDSAGISSMQTISDSCPSFSPEEELKELFVLYHEATNLYGGLCLLKGELKSALDTYYSVIQSSSGGRSSWKTSSLSASRNPSSFEHFQLPMICILPGTRNHHGDLVDSTKLSTKNLGEVLRHLDELELRYGPDPCVYFHRANVHKALGEFEQFVHDLSLVESMDPGFLKVYIQKEFFGDFLDLETISWIPLQFVEALHGALERHEFMIPSAVVVASLAATSPTRQSSQLASPRDRLPAHSKHKVGRNGGSSSDAKGNQGKAMHRQLPLVSEVAMYLYFQKRIETGGVLDEYAHVFQLDVFRRLPEARRNTHNLTNLATRQHLSPWEGVVFDESLPSKKCDSSENPAHELIKSVLSKFGRNPCVHMIAGIVELELFNASVAYIYFTEAISLINKQQAVIAASSGVSTATTNGGDDTSSLARRWQQRVLDRVRFYCLIWRSMASRIKIEMEKAVEDLNMAAAIKLDEPTSSVTSVDDPLLLVQRTLIMLLNGHLKSAFKLLRQLKQDMKQVARRTQGRDAKDKVDALMQYQEWLQITDMFGNAGLNSFSLLPLPLEKESSHVSNSAANDKNVATNSHGDGGDDQVKAIEDDEEAAAAIVRYALSKRPTTPSGGGRAGAGSNLLQTETLDKFFESGLIKLSASGSIIQTTPFFQAILSIDESYLPPTNFASLELLKCKEEDVMEEKLYNCFIRLGKRSKWLHKKVRWKFEAFIDANLAHAYLPSDMETLWHRARLLKDQGNYISAINDLSGCLELMNSQITWEKGKKKGSSKVKAVFLNETKRTQWLQLLLERGRVEMALKNWEQAIQDLTVVISQVGKSNELIEASALDAKSTSLIHLSRFGHAIQDLQHILSLSKSKKVPSSSANKSHAYDANRDGKEHEEMLLNCILIGNLYCHLALDQMKVSATVSQKNAAFTPFILEQLKTMHLNMGFITKAEEYYDEALKVSPEHFLVYYFRGRMLALSAQPKKAAECLSDCLRRHPMFLPALFLRGCIYAQQSLTILALADFYRVRHRAPSYPNLHTSIGFCQFDCGSMTKAVEALTEAVQQDPQDSDAFYIRGCALQELFVLDNAVKDFARVLTLNSDHFRALYQRSVCNVLYQRYRDALADLSRAIQLQPEWKEAWILHAYACFCSGHYEDAVISYGRAIGLRDGSVDSSRGPTTVQRDSLLFMHRSLANMYANHLSAALLDLDLALKRDNENYVGFVAKAFMLLKVGEYDRAMQMLLHALPQYKKMRLMSPCDVIDAERAKAFKKVQSNEQQRAGSFIGNPFASVGAGCFSSSVSAIAVATPLVKRQSIESRHPKISATSDAIFLFRKLSREDQEQRAQAYRQRSVAAKPAEIERPRRPSSLIPPRRKTLVGAGLTATPPSLDTVADDIQQQLKNQLLQRCARNAKFTRAIKKLTFEYRVLKALESATSAKYKKNEQMARELSDLMRTKSSVPWPKGTLTSNLLVWAFNLLGTYHLGNRKVDDALMAFSLAIQAHPYNPVTFFNRGNVFLHIEVLSSAVTGFQDAIDADEGCFQAYNNMGVALFELKRLDDAHDAFATGLHHVDERRHKAILLYNLGVILQNMDKQDEAMEFYQQAITLDGSRTEFFNNRSSILHQQLKFTVALEDYNRALSLGTNAEEGGSSGDAKDKIVMVIGNNAGNNRKSCIEARLNRAQLFITMGNCTAAIIDLKVVLKALTLGREGDTKRKVTAGSPDRNSTVTSVVSAVSEALSPDEVLAEELLAFCDKWKDAIRIAVKDFLFGLDAFSSLAAFELYSYFGSQLGLPKAELLAGGVTDDDSTPRDSQSMLFCPLPIADPSFFDYERALRHWTSEPPSEHDKEADNQYEHAEDNEPDDKVRECKEKLINQPFGNYLREAMRHCQESDFESSARCLLRAHYKTTLDSPEEYFLIIWRVQVVMKVCGQSNTDSAFPVSPVDTGFLRAITLLQDFLSERQHPEEDSNNDDEQSERSTFQSKPKRLQRPGPDGLDEEEDELTEQELLWRQQRRTIRADAYTFLGSLYQLNGQVVEARNAFSQALRIRNDHFIALLNFLQLSIVESEYEIALDCILRVFELVFARTGDNNSGAQPPFEIRGLLNASRTTEVMFPGLSALRGDTELTSFGGNMLQLLREYKNLLSAHIQSNTSHIFRKQGMLAHLVKEIRQVLRLRESKRISSKQQQQQQEIDISILDLEEFNKILDEYTASILEQTNCSSTLSDEPPSVDQDTLQTSFLTEFAQVCNQVTRSLPPEALQSMYPKRPRLGTSDSDASSRPGTNSPSSQPPKPRALKSASSASSRKASSALVVLRRPTMTSLTAHTLHRRATVLITDTMIGSSQKNLVADSSATTVRGDLGSARKPLQPQRPQTDPEILQVAPWKEAQIPKATNTSANSRLKLTAHFSIPSQDTSDKLSAQERTGDALAPLRLRSTISHDTELHASCAGFHDSWKLRPAQQDAVFSSCMLHQSDSNHFRDQLDACIREGRFPHAGRSLETKIQEATAFLRERTEQCGSRWRWDRCCYRVQGSGGGQQKLRVAERGRERELKPNA